jgi:hypothetical protein
MQSYEHITNSCIARIGMMKSRAVDTVSILRLYQCIKIVFVNQHTFVTSINHLNMIVRLIQFNSFLYY